MTLLRYVSAISVIALTAACGAPSDAPTPETSSQPGQLFPNWPTLLNDFRFHWSAEPGIDVTAGPAMVVRAYLESYTVGQDTFDVNNVYPGFNRATPENLPREGNYQFQLVNIRPMGAPFTATPKDAVQRFGFDALHFLELTPVGNGYRAIVCRGDYANFVASRSKPGKFVSVGFSESAGEVIPRDSSGVSGIQIELTQHDPRVGPNPPAAVTGPQRGPLPAPDQDVFGNWFITGAGDTFWGPKNDPKSFRHDLEERCEAAMPTPAAERIAMMTGFKDQPPPHGEAIPGWPAKSQ
ncbi:MAG TPA: hypothetical protein VL634_01710 [Mycobacterium sp.]|nr:hypothetical protein [Mycobacterium sp.]